MKIKTKVIIGDAEKNREVFYTKMERAHEDGWIEAITKHKKDLSFCILYKEVREL